MDATTVPAAQDALAVILRGLDAVDEFALPVDVGFPPGGVLNEHVWVAGDVDESDQGFLVSSLQAKQEQFTLRVHVLFTAMDPEYVTPRDRCQQVIDEFAGVVAVDFTLSGAVQLAQVGGVEWDDAIPDPSSRQVMATVKVACEAWLA